MLRREKRLEHLPQVRETLKIPGGIPESAKRDTLAFAPSTGLSNKNFFAVINTARQ